MSRAPAPLHNNCDTSPGALAWEPGLPLVQWSGLQAFHHRILNMVDTLFLTASSFLSGTRFVLVRSESLSAVFDTPGC
eukprot:6204491-Pleurochrysis_carterae.AAC.2